MLSRFILNSQFGSGIQDPGSYFAADADSAVDLNAFSNIEIFISNVIAVLTVLGGLFFVFFFVQAAFTWITAGGDSGNIEKARNKMVQGVIGLIVLVASYALVGVIGSIVGLDLLNPAATLTRLSPGSSSSSFSSMQDCLDAGNSFSYCDSLR